MKVKKLQKIILNISEGLLASTTDLTLYLFFLSGATLFKPYSPRSVYEAFAEADHAIGEINYQTIKRVFLRLKNNGFLTKDWKITENGYKRLRATLPYYQKDRFWNKKIYLITYDIPKSHNRDRDILRDYLKKLGCALLQESVWLTPYNPQMILSDFVQERNLSGTILVSNLGLGGKVGEEDLKTLIKRIYKLDSINEKYQEFISKYIGLRSFSKIQMAFDFNIILDQDPQLPFDLLPDGWLGDKAYFLYKLPWAESPGFSSQA